MDDLLTPKEQNLIIEDALQSYPLATMPKGITGLVLARIRTEPAPRFKLTRNDFLLAVALSLVLGAILFGFRSLPPHLILLFKFEFRVFCSGKAFL
jgi:hypothetical protein